MCVQHGRFHPLNIVTFFFYTVADWLLIVCSRVIRIWLLFYDKLVEKLLAISTMGFFSRLCAPSNNKLMHCIDRKWFWPFDKIIRSNHPPFSRAVICRFHTTNHSMPCTFHDECWRWLSLIILFSELIWCSCSMTYFFLAIDFIRFNLKMLIGATFLTNSVLFSLCVCFFFINFMQFLIQSNLKRNDSQWNKRCFRKIYLAISIAFASKH